MSKNTEIKLNIGCGYLNTPKNWVNIDNSFSARIAKYHSLSLKLKQCGFVRVVQKKYLDSQIEDINHLDNPDRFRDSICIEASKAKGLKSGKRQQKYEEITPV